MAEIITLDHGSGGETTRKLIADFFAKSFGISEPMTDSAILPQSGSLIAFTTDSYVISPIFFPGGDIGKLAVCGTVNDLSVSGAIPSYISASFIIEEGFPAESLKTISSSMALEAKKAGVKIVTGDTKVVERGKCDQIFISTSGIGYLDKKFQHVSTGQNIKPGDKLIVNGNLAEHAIAILGARKQLNFSTPVQSDCASLNHLIKNILDNNIDVKFMRDVTRGGLATVLNELVRITGLRILIDENEIPVNEYVLGLCEVLGFDPLYLANEGKAIFVVSESESIVTLNLLKSSPLGINSRIIGEFQNGKNNEVVLISSVGGLRILPPMAKDQLPRIC